MSAATLRFVAVTICAILAAARAFAGSALPEQTVTMWTPCAEWSLRNPTHEGNPFDLAAKVMFRHESGQEVRTTEMFYAGRDTWKFRFAGTRLGRWAFTTASGDSDLDGHSGTVNVVADRRDPNAIGFMSNDGQTWQWEGSKMGFIPQLVMIGANQGASPALYDTPGEVHQLTAAFLGHHGFTGFHTSVIGGHWFTFGAGTRLTSDMKNPDPRTFAALETLITSTHRLGGLVHIWAWGDRGRGQTPWEIEGGINGSVDRRLQRYIAARLGPIPGWSMGYGFDLDEWTNEQDLDSWNRFMQAHMGWHHYLGGRPKGPNGGTRHGHYNGWNDGMEYSSYEHHKPDYEVCVGALAELRDQPVLSEDRNRVRGRRKDWTEEETRRGLWQSTMAGGVGNIWGHLNANDKVAGTGVYGNKDELKTYSTFWFYKGRFLPGMTRTNQRSDDTDEARPNDVNRDRNTRVLMASRDQVIFYRQDASSIHMDLSGMSEPQPAIAVDTTKPYREIRIGPVRPGEQTWTAPHRSDWAIAVGRFEKP